MEINKKVWSIFAFIWKRLRTALHQINKYPHTCMDTVRETHGMLIQVMNVIAYP